MWLLLQLLVLFLQLLCMQILLMHILEKLLVLLPGLYQINGFVIALLDQTFGLQASDDLLDGLVVLLFLSQLPQFGLHRIELLDLRLYVPQPLLLILLLLSNLLLRPPPLGSRLHEVVAVALHDYRVEQLG